MGSEKSDFPRGHIAPRLKDYDYSQPGAYFVTICTCRRERLFGSVVNGEMIPNRCGKIVEEEWLSLPQRYPSVMLGKVIVMPNHIHGIINLVGAGYKPARIKMLKADNYISLQEIIRNFKTFSARKINAEIHRQNCSVWQRGFYDHIINSDKAFDNIEEYIMNNPKQWEDDLENDKYIMDK